jgi:EmrB/QacA subfamily drug resistance transporter
MMQAIGGSMLNPVALSIINSVFTEPKERAKAIGVWGGTVGISTAAGPIVGGALVSGVGWRSIFYINIPIGIAALFLTAKFVPESKAAKHRRVDPVGQLSIIGFLSLLLYGIIEAPTKGWTSPLIIACFVASIAFLINIIRYEGKRKQPLIELRFFKSAPFSGATIIAICTFIGLGGFLFLNTLYLQDVRDFSAEAAGLHLIPMAFAMLVFGPISGRVVAARGSRLPLTIGGLALTLTAAMFALAGSGLSIVNLLIGYAFIGMGIGFINAAITNTALSGMPRSQAGVAAATTSTSRQVGQALGVAIIGSILASNASAISKGAAFSSDWKTCWFVICGVGFLLLLAANITTSKWGLKTAEKFSKEIEAEETALNPAVA